MNGQSDKGILTILQRVKCVQQLRNCSCGGKVSFCISSTVYFHISHTFCIKRLSNLIPFPIDYDLRTFFGWILFLLKTSLTNNVVLSRSWWVI